MLDLGYAPHLTLLVMDDESFASTLGASLVRPAAMVPPRLILGQVRSFPQTDVVFLSVEGPLPELFALHQAACELLPADSVRPHYRPAKWTLHITLQTVGDATRALALTSSRWHPDHLARTMRMELATFLPVRVGEGIALR
jgi:hypothetical protein